MRLGFTIRIYGSPGLSSYYKGRSLLAVPDLSVNLAYLRDILHYLRANDIHMYRMHSRLLPWREKEIFKQIREYARELALVGELARQFDVRLSFHPYHLGLSVPDEERARRNQILLEALAALLEAMGLGPEAVIVLHVGGVHEGKEPSRERFLKRYEALPACTRARLVLENDDRRFAHEDVRFIHQRCGIPLVFDNLHHQVLNPGRIPFHEALAYSLGTWPEHVVPKVHFSTPRTEMRFFERTSRIKVPTWTEHSDFVNPFEFISFMQAAKGLRPFDVMLEAKARDIALLKLREDLRRFAPELAQILS
ncbi:MAG: UV DNA damage repair endonuclease UvsE [Anaerolineae bacterium]|nr:UV DNA damage repair endonuclease UvsE [Anaerolineae bacterium]